MQSEYIIEMLNIRKEFPGIVANDNITLQLRRGEIHALLGENGAGKSTLMSVLFGLYQPEAGQIKKNGEVVKINNPNDATALNIGMVHQHFKLVDVGCTYQPRGAAACHQSGQTQAGNRKKHCRLYAQWYDVRYRGYDRRCCGADGAGAWAQRYADCHRRSCTVYHPSLQA